MPSRPTRAAAPRTVLMTAYPGIQPLDAIGPLEVFHVATRLWERDRPKAPAPYKLLLVGTEPGPIPTPAGYALYCDRSYRSYRGPIDTLMVPGGSGSRTQRHDEAFIAWLRRAARRSRRVCSVCSGALLLAAAGLLQGRRATTHWAACDLLAREHPGITVEPDPIFVQDGHVYTSAGVLAGIDLALALVEDDLGTSVALEVARWLLVFLKRPGGQSQFSAHLDQAAQPSRVFQDLVGYIAEHPEADLCVPSLARRARMSPRNFARRFQHELGASPGQYVMRVRIEAARSRLERGEESVEEVSVRCGFGCAETMRRAFTRTLGVSPSDYRARFGV